MVFMPSQIVIREGTHNSTLYFINRGVVEVLIGISLPPSMRKRLATLRSACPKRDARMHAREEDSGGAAP